MQQERAEPHGQFTGIDDFIARATSTVGPRGCHQGRQHAKNHTGFGVAVLNCMQEFKNRPFWTSPSGLKRAACHVLAALSTLQQQPHVPLFENCNIDLYVRMMYSEVDVPSYSL
jgi:hypothetical protein